MIVFQDSLVFQDRGNTVGTRPPGHAYVKGPPQLINGFQQQTGQQDQGEGRAGESLPAPSNATAKTPEAAVTAKPKAPSVTSSTT